VTLIGKAQLSFDLAGAENGDVKSMILKSSHSDQFSM